MDSVGIPDPSPPFNPFNFKDCSQDFCTAFCPQNCPFILPPPPPLFGFDDSDDSSTFFSPLIVAVIGILASAFVLVTYYAIVSKYCRRRVDDGGGGGGGGPGENFETDRAINETRQSGAGPGLDEALIKSISVFKFKKGEGLIEGSDCSVCLSEFQENESLRLLPKCSHAFHLACIDTWLKSNSSCPLCRCNIASTNPPPPETPPPSVTALGYRHSSDAAVVVVQDLSANVSQEAVVVEIVSDSTNQDQGSPNPNPNPNPNPPSFVTERREESVRSIRSVSEDHQSSPCPGRNLSVADILSINHEEDEEIEAVDSSTAAGIGSSNGGGKETEKSRNRNGVLNSAMRMSISTGIFSFARYAKGKNSNLPN